MKKFKKAALTAASYVSVAALAIGGTMAYLTDTESNKNTMTMGKVDIEQHEYERLVDEGGDFVIEDTSNVDPNYGYTSAYELQEFTQNKPAMPAVYTNDKKSTAWDDFQQLWYQAGAPGSNDLFDDSMKNVIDKFVFVENTGKSNAYYRTIVAIEVPEGIGEKVIHTNFNANNRFDYNVDEEGVQHADDSNKFYAEIDGTRYLIYTATYTDVLAPGEVSRPSLLQLYLDPNTTNEDCELFGDEWDVRVVSQAVQTDGFKDAATALETAFGKISAENHPWLTTTEVTDKASALAAFKTGGNVALSGDINLTPDADAEPTGNVIADDTILDMNGNSIKYDVEYVSGMNGTQISALTVDKDADLTIIDGNVEATSAYGIYVKDGNCVINGGTYTGGTSAIQVYNGTLQITSGKFEVTSENSTYLINCIDGNYKDGSAKVIITGGSFKEWNPADNAAEGAGTNFVAPGYKVVEEEIDGVTWYTVVAE